MTIVEAVATIDDLTHRLAQDKELITELLGIISALETERDTWRAQAGR